MIRVVAAIIERQGELLICQRRRDRPFGGQWEFPGGKMRPSETPREALARELREELGIEARIGQELYVMRHRYPGEAGATAPDAAPGDSAGAIGMDVQVRFFRAWVTFGQPRNICFERILWVRRGDLPRYDFLAGDRKVVSRLARGEFL